MINKLIYWIPFLGVLVSLVNYNKENDMGAFWAYYQAFVTLGLIFAITFISIGK